jgi:hypothetical protein
MVIEHAIRAGRAAQQIDFLAFEELANDDEPIAVISRDLLGREIAFFHGIGVGEGEGERIPFDKLRVCEKDEG